MISPTTNVAARRRVRLCFFNTWAQGLEDAASYVARVPAMPLEKLVANPRDPEMMRMARLDCDWYGENARCLAALAHPNVEFQPAWITGPAGLLDLARAQTEPEVERWLVMIGHQPQALGAAAGRVFGLLHRHGVRHFFYAYDEASRCMPCFAEIAPCLDVLIHDESPLDPPARAGLSSRCHVVHRSWVANLRPFAVPFESEPEARLLFLGSKMGFTPHRRRQVEFLQKHLRDRFVAIHDHSVPVAERSSLASRFKASLCPEGRKFGSPAMSATHTDRPFWSGCLGLVPVSEDSSAGGRLEDLHRAELIRRYPRGGLPALLEACERALAAPAAERWRIYDHFNRHETVGTVVAEAIAAFPPVRMSAPAEASPCPAPTF
jgi:hypothetical protein